MVAEYFNPYKAFSSNKTLQEVFDEINTAFYRAHGPDYRYGSERIIVNPIQAYERFLSLLMQNPLVEFSTFGQLFSGHCYDDKICVLIRHDVDGDIVAAVRQAEIEQRFGVVSTYFFLHTAPYHGTFKESIFHRYECIKHVYRRVQDLGHEVGLHNDCLNIYQNWQVNGAQALVTELEWMRTVGLDVVGTVAHNSLEVYGAENFEIFTGRPLVKWEPKHPGDYKKEDEVCFNGKKSPLRVLDESELGLYYEGNDAFKHGDGLVEYGATRFLNSWRWNTQIKRWKANPEPPNTWFADEDTVITDILGLSPGTLVILTIHPVYYGCRHSRHRGPVLKRKQTNFVINEMLGWETYQPECVQCHFKDTVEDTRQSINFSNELGMLDKPWASLEKETLLRILLLGSDNLDARNIGVDAQCQVLLEGFLKTSIGKKVAVRKLAFPGMGISRLWAWYEALKGRLKPHIVCLGIGGEALRQNVPELWSAMSGYSITHPPGSYITWDNKRQRVLEVTASTSWAIRQMKSRDAYLIPKTGRDAVEILLNRDKEALDLIENLYGYVIEFIRKEGGVPILFVEDLGTLPIYNERKAIDVFSPSSKTMRGIIADVSSALKTPLIDPYEAFESKSSGLPACDTDGRWNYTGHRLAAEALFQCIVQLSFPEKVHHKDCQ